MAPPAKKSRTGLVLGLVIGLVALLGLGGGAVWYFVLGPAQTSDLKTYPDYKPTVAPASPGGTFAYTFPKGFDGCGILDLSAVNETFPNEGKAEGSATGDTANDGTGEINCAQGVTIDASTTSSDFNGGYSLKFDIHKDAEAAKASYQRAAASPAFAYKAMNHPDTGDESQMTYIASKTYSKWDFVEVYISVRNGNLTVYGTFRIQYHRELYAQPNPGLLGNLLVDGANQGMTSLAGA
jgi:hypothetical protein